MTSHVVLAWEDFDLWIADLVKTVRFSQQSRKSPLKFVYGPPRGGVIPAVALSHRLGIPWVGSFRELSDALWKTEGTFADVLWVDEIVESGKTLETFLDQCLSHPLRGGDPLKTCWVSKLPSTRFPALHSGITVEKDTWVVFPWEDPITWKRELEEYNARRQ